MAQRSTVAVVDVPLTESSLQRVAILLGNIDLEGKRRTEPVYDIFFI
jgi:hypothetical protein